MSRTIPTPEELLQELINIEHKINSREELEVTDKDTIMIALKESMPKKHSEEEKSALPPDFNKKLLELIDHLNLDDVYFNEQNIYKKIYIFYFLREHKKNEEEFADYFEKKSWMRNFLTHSGVRIQKK